MKIVNLTPHTVSLYTNVGVITCPVSDLPTMRVSQSIVYLGNVDGIPFTRNVYGEVENMPPAEEGVIYITSSLCAAAIVATHPERTDFVVPNEAVRDEQGRIIGCRSFAYI